MPWSLAILIETGTNAGSKVEQQSSRPHEPMPPTILASSRAPIWRISMRACSARPRSLHQIAEVDALLRREVEEHLAAGESGYSTRTTFIGRRARGCAALQKR